MLSLLFSLTLSAIYQGSLKQNNFVQGWTQHNCIQGSKTLRHIAYGCQDLCILSQFLNNFSIIYQ